MLKILTIGGGQLGFGHINRCMSIVAAALETNEPIMMFVKNFGDNLVLPQTNIFELDWVHDISGVNLGSKDVVILDVLEINENALDLISSLVNRVFLIDDIGIPMYDHLHRIDWSIKSYVLGLKNRPSKSEHVIGLEYVPLRKSFRDLVKKNISNNIGRILVTLGGSDIKNITPSLLAFLSSNHPEVMLTTLVGPGFSNRDEILKFESAQIRIIIEPNDDQILTEMLRADLAIATGGHTMYELAAVGTPVIQIQVAKNQEVSKYWELFGFSQFIGWYDDPKFWDKLTLAISYFESKDVRQKSSNEAQFVIDGCGSLRLIKEVVGYNVG